MKKLSKIFLYLLFYIYINVVIYCSILMNNVYFYIGIKYLLIVTPVSIFIEFIILKFFPLLINKINIISENNQKNRKKFLLFFVLVTTILFGITYLLYKPGGVMYDTMLEYSEASGTRMLDNWHTIWHVILFYKLPLLIHESYGTVVIFQIILFIIVLTYLIYVLYKNNINYKLILLFCIFLWINPHSYYFIFFPFKDSSFSIIMIALVAIFIDKYFNRDKYNNKFSIFGICLLFIIGALIKRNSILASLPLLLIYVIFFDKKKMFIYILFSLIIYGGFMYADKKIEYYDIYEYNVESCGFFLNMASYVLKVNPSVMDGKYRDMLDDVSTQNYQIYDINLGFESMKNDYFTKGLDQYGKLNLIKIGIHALRYDPKHSTLALFNSIKELYSIKNSSFGFIYNEYNERINGVDSIEKFNNMYQEKMNFLLYCSFGLILFIFVSLFVVGVVRKLRWCLFTLPIIIYQCGTSLILTFYDSRYFEHTFFIFIPLLMLILVDNYKIQSKK